MKLSSLLDKEQMLLEMRSSGYPDAIRELVDHLSDTVSFKEDTKAEIIASLLEREDQTSTGIGSGVAIPHTFSEDIEEVLCVFGRSKEGIDFEALDNAPVKLVILFVVPKEDYHKHLQTLAAIAKIFTNCEVRKALEKAETKDEVHTIFDSRPSRVALEQ